MGDERFRRLSTAMRVLLALVSVSSVVALVLGPRYGRFPATAGFGLIILTPVLRISWLAMRWIGRRDWKYAVVAFGVLVIAILGFVLALQSQV